MFREIVKVLHEYGFVHRRPLAIPKNRIDFIIATFEGLRMDWPTITTDSLRAVIRTLACGKKVRSGVGQ